MTLSLALAAREPVYVDAQDLGGEQGSRLYGDLLVRLLEEGWALARPPHGTVLHVSRRVDGTIEMTAVVEDRKVVREVAPGPASAVRLEVLHRAVEILQEVERDRALVPKATIAIDVRDGHNVTVPVDAGVIEAVLESGGTVVSNTGSPTWRLCIVVEGDREAWMRVPGERSCGASTNDAISTSRDATHVALLEQVAADVEEWSSPLEAEVESAIDDGHEDSTPESVVAPPVAAPARTEKTGSHPKRQGGVRLWIGAGVGLATRGRAVEAAVPLSVAVTHKMGFGGLVRATGLVGPTVRDLRVFDVTIGGGPAWVRPVSPQLAFGAAFLAGVFVHTYRFDDQKTSRDVAADLQLPLWLMIRIARGLGLGLGVTSGVVLATWDHRIFGESIWIRRPFRFEATALVVYAWGWT